MSFMDGIDERELLGRRDKQRPLLVADRKTAVALELPDARLALGKGLQKLTVPDPGLGRYAVGRVFAVLEKTAFCRR